jgi:hypothetical protein
MVGISPLGWEVAVLVSLLSLGSPPERFMEPNDDKPPNLEDTAWKFRR